MSCIFKRGRDHGCQIKEPLYRGVNYRVFFFSIIVFKEIRGYKIKHYNFGAMIRGIVPYIILLMRYCFKRVSTELTVCNTLSSYYRALELAFVRKYFKILLGKGQDNQLIFTLTPGLKFPLTEKVNRQNRKIWTVNVTVKATTPWNPPFFNVSKG